MLNKPIIKTHHLLRNKIAKLHNLILTSKLNLEVEVVAKVNQVVNIKLLLIMIALSVSASIVNCAKRNLNLRVLIYARAKVTAEQ